MDISLRTRAHSQLAGVTALQHHQPPVSPVFSGISNDWGLPGWMWMGATTTGTTADRTFYTPIWCDGVLKWDRIAVNVQVGGAAGTLIRLGLYSAKIQGNGRMAPDALITDYGTVTADTAANKLITIDETPPAGYSFIYFGTDAVATMQAIDAERPWFAPVSPGSSALFTASKVIGMSDVADAIAALPALAPAQTQVNPVSSNFVMTRQVL